MIYAHRGLSAEHPENTLAAFRAAVEAGFDGIELDVRVTVDGEVVCLHDAGIERTTDGNGRVADMKWAEVATYHAHDGGPGVPRLADVLAELGSRTKWNVEVKAYHATAPTLDLLDGYDAMLTSMDPRSLAIARDHAPSMPRGLIVLGPPDEDDISEARGLECEWLMVDHDFLGQDLIERLRAAGLRVGAWTVNDADEAAELQAFGAEMMITDVRDLLP